MGVLGSALASLCHFTVLQRAGATNALLVTLIMPLTPIVLGGLFLGEQLTRRDMAGAAVIAAALLMIDGRLLRRLRSCTVPSVTPHPTRCGHTLRTSMISAGRNTRSAISEASSVVPHTKPKRRRLGRSENTVTPSPNASTSVVRMMAGPDQHARAADGELGARLEALLQAQAVEEMDERVDGEPEHHQQRHHGGELEPAAHQPR